MPFNPVNSPHSIERCSAAVFFSEFLPEKLLQSFVADLDKKLPTGFVRSPTRTFKFDVATGQVTTQDEVNPAVPATYVAADGAAQFVLAPGLISWSTQRYVRWKPYLGQFETYFSPIIDKILDAVSPKACRLEYLDRFFWAGTPDDFDISALLKADSRYVAARTQTAAVKQWHNHCGWFERVEQFRRLTNVNIDVTDSTEASPRPTVGIYTLMQDEANVPGFGDTPPVDLNRLFITNRLNDLHHGLKTLLQDIISDRVAEQIGLLS